MRKMKLLGIIVAFFVVANGQQVHANERLSEVKLGYAAENISLFLNGMFTGMQKNPNESTTCTQEIKSMSEAFSEFWDTTISLFNNFGPVLAVQLVARLNDFMNHFDNSVAN